MPEEKEFEREVLERLIKIESKLESWDSAKKQIYENQRDIIKLYEQAKQQQQDINEMKDGNRWLKRTTIGAALTASFSIVVAVITSLF